MMALEAFGSLVWRHWRLVVPGLIIAALGIALLLAKGDARHWQKRFDNEVAAHMLDNAKIEAASAKAIADNLADVRAKEGDAATITEKVNHDLESQLADARRLATDYARRMRAAAAGTDQGSAGEARLGETAGTPGSLSGTSGLPELDADDVRICSVNTIKAREWANYYASLRERYNTDGTP